MIRRASLYVNGAHARDPTLFELEVLIIAFPVSFAASKVPTETATFDFFADIFDRRVVRGRGSDRGGAGESN